MKLANLLFLFPETCDLEELATAFIQRSSMRTECIVFKTYLLYVVVTFPPIELKRLLIKQ
jgi:hypothetical protein